jgi:hypothetical protein
MGGNLVVSLELAMALVYVLVLVLALGGLKLAGESPNSNLHE